MLVPANPIAVVTPFVKGGVRLPDDDEINAIKSHTSAGFITSEATAAVDLPGSVRAGLTESTTEWHPLYVASGHVRLRKSIGANDWVVHAFAPAAALG
jgi:hypothetical protein